MKLGALKAAIKALSGAPRIYVQVGGIIRIEPELIKGRLLEELDKAFPGGKAIETGLCLKDGMLGKEGNWPVS